MNSPFLAPVIPLFPASFASPLAAAVRKRFTIDGDEALEAKLEGVCELARVGVQQIVPSQRLEGMVLVGSYGRGEGGVLGTESLNQPYHDLEFVIFFRSGFFARESRLRHELADLAFELSSVLGIKVRFTLESLRDLERAPITVRNYETVCAHHCVHGDDLLFDDCGQHKNPEDLPLTEASRLLLNHCSELLIAERRLERRPCSAEDLGYAARHLAGARLALGDALLIAVGQYHWSYRERAERLDGLEWDEQIPMLEAIRTEHARGVAFRRHPAKSTLTEIELGDALHQVSLVASQLWLWIEGKRLGTTFSTALEYAFHPDDKWPTESSVANAWKNIRRFGPSAILEASAFRHPRERLCRALPILLWLPALLRRHAVQIRLQNQLRTEATDEAGLLQAYAALWQPLR